MLLPSGTITFLFTDIEGSTRLWEEHPQAMRLALARHDALMRQAIEDNEGAVFKTIGDAFCAVFATASDALAAALAAQLAFHAEVWPEAIRLRVRMALHTGAAERREGDYFGQPLNRVARLLGVGHGGQTLLSDVAHDLTRDTLPSAAGLKPLGEHRLRDLGRPEAVFQLLHPDLPREFPPLKSLDYLPTNLLRQMTSFIGREHEIAEVKQFLPSTSLLTLVGTGGVGKTRLALQVAADVLDTYKDGVWLVELAALADPDLVPQTVATALGLREAAGRPLLQSLQDYLRDRQLLLLLDNCEHLLNACASLADTLLKRCPHVTMLVTSRQPLGIAGEHIWRVPPLLTPAFDVLLSEEKDLASEVMGYDACRLFVERAMVQRQDFVLTRKNVPVVAHLCRQLDGIPLAIELAAARVRSLSVEEIDSKLDNRFRLLTGGSRTALPRQQTLRALIDWSFDLLNAQEKGLLCRLSVFGGGWTLQAAEAVSSGQDIEEWEMLDLLTSLADKSLVVTETGDELTRYHLLETVRQYARDRLEESGEGASVRERHQAFFAGLAEKAEPHLVGPEQAAWLDRLAREHDNLRAALEGSDKEAALHIACALYRFWDVRGYHTEGRKWLADTLASAGVIAASPVRAKALYAAGWIAHNQGDYAAAQALFEQSLALFEELGDQRGIANSFTSLGHGAHEQGAYAAAYALHKQSLALFQELGDKQGVANSLGNLGNVTYIQGDYMAAQAFHEQSLTIKRELGNKRGVANSLGSLGNVAYDLGDYAAAQAFHEQSLVIKRELGNKQGIAKSLMNLGLVIYAQGDYVSAQTLYEESLAMKRELGNKMDIANSLINLGNVAHDQGDYVAMRLLYEESLALSQESGYKRGLVYSLEAFAALAFVQEQGQRATLLWGVAEALREKVGIPLPPSERTRHENLVAQARKTMDADAFAAIWSQGRTMPLEQAIKSAMEKSDK